MCVENGREPLESEKKVVGYCFQREKKIPTLEGTPQFHYHGTFRSTHEHTLGKKYPMKVSASGDATEAGFHGFFSISSATELEEAFLEEEMCYNEGDIVLMEAEFDEVFDIGTSATFGLDIENGITVFRAKHRKLLKVVKRYGWNYREQAILAHGEDGQG